jgi:hypothetical protein
MMDKINSGFEDGPKDEQTTPSSKPDKTERLAKLRNMLLGDKNKP